MKQHFVILRYLDNTGYYCLDKIPETDPHQAAEYCIHSCAAANGWGVDQVKDEVEVVAVLSGDDVCLELVAGDF